MFANARQLVSQAKQAAKDNLETAERITQNANQIAESLPLSKGRSYVLGQYPRVLHPSVRDTIIVKLTGVNLDLADAQLVLGNGHRARRSQLGAQEVMFRVPMAALTIDTTKFQLHTLRFTHSSRKGSGLFNPIVQVKREIEIATLPRTVGRFSFTGTRKFQNRESEAFTADAGRFSGRSESVNRIARPKDGWRWDLTQPIVQVSTGSGEAGRCSEILLNESNENGIVVRARLDEIREVTWRGIRYSGGYKYCGAQGTIYRMVDAEGPIPALDGRITWMRDLIVPMPIDTKDFALQVNLFTSEGRVFTNADQCQYFTVVKEPGRLVIHPTIPKGVDL